MRIEGSMGHAMHQLDDVPIFDDVDGLVHGKVLPFWPFDDPPIIDVLFSNRVLLIIIRLKQSKKNKKMAGPQTRVLGLHILC